MAKRASKRRGKPSTAERKSHRAPRERAVQSSVKHALVWLAIALASAGAVLTLYLTYTKVFGEHPAYCADGSSCDVVQSSRWSNLLGIPLSGWGFLTYTLLILLLWRMLHKASVWRWVWWLSAFAFVLSAYLTAVSIIEIEATCAYCLVSFGLITALLGVVSISRPSGLPDFNWASFATGGFGSALLVVALMHLHWSGVFDASAGPEKPYLKALATHLSETGAVFYGAYWCPNCNAQKQLFEASMERLPYQECTPAGRDGPRSLACVRSAINAYPTWVINGQRYEGILNPKELATLSGFPG